MDSVRTSPRRERQRTYPSHTHGIADHPPEDTDVCPHCAHAPPRPADPSSSHLWRHLTTVCAPRRIAVPGHPSEAKRSLWPEGRPQGASGSRATGRSSRVVGTRCAGSAAAIDRAYPTVPSLTGPPPHCRCTPATYARGAHAGVNACCYPDCDLPQIACTLITGTDDSRHKSEGSTQKRCSEDVPRAPFRSNLHIQSAKQERTRRRRASWVLSLSPRRAMVDVDGFPAPRRAAPESTGSLQARTRYSPP